MKFSDITNLLSNKDARRAVEFATSEKGRRTMDFARRAHQSYKKVTNVRDHKFIALLGFVLGALVLPAVKWGISYFASMSLVLAAVGAVVAMAYLWRQENNHSTQTWAIYIVLGIAAGWLVSTFFLSGFIYFLLIGVLGVIGAYFAVNLLRPVRVTQS